jgi:hypothetical protein
MVWHASSDARTCANVSPRSRVSKVGRAMPTGSSRSSSPARRSSCDRRSGSRTRRGTRRCGSRRCSRRSPTTTSSPRCSSASAVTPSGFFDGERLVASKVGSRFVKNRHKKGGSSANRFRRRREEQAQAVIDEAAGDRHPRAGALARACRVRRPRWRRWSDQRGARSEPEARLAVGAGHPAVLHRPETAPGACSSGCPTSSTPPSSSPSNGTPASGAPAAIPRADAHRAFPPRL